MEPIAQITSPVQDSKTIQILNAAPHGPGRREDFESVLKARQSSGEKREGRKDTKAGDQDTDANGPLMTSVASSAIHRPPESHPSAEAAQDQREEKDSSVQDGDGPKSLIAEATIPQSEGSEGQVQEVKEQVDSIKETLIPLPPAAEGQPQGEIPSIKDQAAFIKETLIPLPPATESQLQEEAPEVQEQSEAASPVTKEAVPLVGVPESPSAAGASMLEGEAHRISEMIQNTSPDESQVIEKELPFSGTIVTRTETPLGSVQSVGRPAGSPSSETSLTREKTSPIQDSPLVSSSASAASGRAEGVLPAGMSIPEEAKPKAPPAADPAMAPEKEPSKSSPPLNSSKVIIENPTGKAETSVVTAYGQKAEEMTSPMPGIGRSPTDPVTQDRKIPLDARGGAAENSLLTRSEDEALPAQKPGGSPIPAWNKLSRETTGIDVRAEKTGDGGLREKPGTAEAMPVFSSEKQYDAVTGASLISKSEAGRPTSASHEAPGLSQTGQAKPEAADILQQIGRKLTWSLGKGEEKIRLQLEPPHLGQLYIEINRQKDALQATVWASSQGTKEILESHRVELQKILKEDGFQLGQFDVFVDQQMRFSQERRETDIAPDRSVFSSREPHGSETQSSSGAAQGRVDPAARGSQRIDLFI